MRKQKPRRVALDLGGLAGRAELWRFASAATRDPAVERWFEEGSSELRAIAKEWFVQMRSCGNDIRELIHDGCPVACVDDAAFAYVNAFKSHVNVGFFYGADLDDPDGLLEGTGKRMRHVKLQPGRPLDAGALSTLIETAYRDAKARVAAESSSRKE
jgi:hypothetical protein